ncbi:MAG: flagellar motor protein MotB [Pseudomonadota bacterium]
MARKKKVEKPENHERWLVSYADFITLLFAFFVTMYSISRVDGKKFGSAVDSLHRALGSVVPMSTSFTTPGFLEGREAPLSIRGQEQAESLATLKEMLDRNVPETNGRGLRITVDARGLVVSFPDVMLFEPCSVELRPDVKPLLDGLAEQLLKMHNPVRVEGHTDDSTCSDWPSNWELSSARASEVVRYLTGKFSFNPARLSVAGYAAFRPVDTNDTNDGRARNRRVDIIVLNEMAQAQEPGHSSGTPLLETHVRR